MDVASIALRFIGRQPTPADDRLCRTFADLLNAAPHLDALSLRDQLLDDLGYVPGRVVTLIERSAAYVVNRPPLSTAPIIAAARGFYLQLVVALRDRLRRSTIVKAFIPAQWFTTLAAKLAVWDVREPLHLPDHLFFMSYAEDQLLYLGEPDLITVIDEGVHELRLSTGKTFNNKLKDLARSRDSFVPTVFELLVLTRAAPRIMDYEPAISTGVPEARIALAGQQALIEARAKMEHYRGGGAFNPAHMGHTLAGKAREKYAGQLSGGIEPVILFMSLDAYVIQDIEPEAMLADVLRDPASRVLSAIVLSETYRAKHFKCWRHPNALRPLTSAMLDDLSVLFSLSEMIPSGHYLPKK